MHGTISELYILSEREDELKKLQNNLSTILKKSFILKLTFFSERHIFSSTKKMKLILISERSPSCPRFLDTLWMIITWPL